MRTLSLTLDAQLKPQFLRIARAIRSAIHTGQLKAKEPLPSARQLAGQLQVNRHTIMAAYQELVAQGWLESVERKGYRVVDHFPIESSRHAQAPVAVSRAKFQWQLAPQPAIAKTGKAAHEYQYNFAGGHPDIAAFPFHEFKPFMSDCLSRPDPKTLSYGNNSGNSQFIEQIMTYLRRVRSITNKDIISVNGSQEALYIISRVLLQPGAKVAVESLGYRPAWNAFETAGAELVAIKQHAGGIDMDHLTELISSRSISLIYLTPLHQYPTTVTLPVHERNRIYRLAAAHNVAIVEDDYDHEFHYSSQPLAPLAADDPLGLVIYLSTFSKIMFPGCRIGFIAVDASLAPALINYRSVMNHKPNVLMQEAIGRWMQEGAFERHLRRTTKLYQQRRDHLVSELQQYQQGGLDIDFSIPAGGMAIWLDVKRDASELEQYSQSQDVYLLAEAHFHLKPENNRNRHVRLGFAGMKPAQITEGLARVFSFFNR
ncbi:PLP-dependent aminotransferase family protein [Shewanella salipaludis]|uniref:PLP-dependent aminotransferase family protein n=1 Tax=Shewanella salipaludis TaxID=2723052 RepID=A0A972G1K5_9GAMM|nr:PLP-dependent aminotransferase family protein [Shewanella salipaludis]NMH66632.1 PLP-dependent aminotransferase family protein [Shewanella salipaludis]